MNVSIYSHKDFSGGLNDSTGDRDIDRNEASLLRNWDITYKNQLYRRPGLTVKGDVLASTTIKRINYFGRTSGAKDLLLQEDTSVWYLNSTTWAELDDEFNASATLDFATCPIDNKLYMCSASDYVHSWDRSSTTKNSAFTDLGTTIPHGNKIIWHKNHMFTMNNVTVSGTAYPNRIYWSAIADPTTWDTTNDQFDLPGGGRVITAGDLGNSLVIFKEYAINYLTGWGDTDWQVTATASNVATLDESVGTFSPRGIVRVGNELWFMDNEGQIRRIYQTDFDAFRRDIVCTKIQSTIDSINKTKLSQVVAWVNNDKVYFAVPTGSSTVNDTVLVFDILASKRTNSEAWTTYTGWSVADFCDYPTSTVPDLYVADSSSGTVYQHTGDDDNDVAIDARWDGKQDDYDKPERWKRFRQGYAGGPALGDISVDYYSAVDGKSFSKLGSLSLATTGSRLGPTGSFLLGPTGDCVLAGGGDNELEYEFGYPTGDVEGKTVKMSIRHATAAQTPYVYGFSNYYRLRKPR